MGVGTTVVELCSKGERLGWTLLNTTEKNGNVYSQGAGWSICEWKTTKRKPQGRDGGFWSNRSSRILAEGKPGWLNTEGGGFWLKQLDRILPKIEWCKEHEIPKVDTSLGRGFRGAWLKFGQGRDSVSDMPKILQLEILRVKEENGCSRLSVRGVWMGGYNFPSLWVGLVPTHQVQFEALCQGYSLNGCVSLPPAFRNSV